MKYLAVLLIFFTSLVNAEGFFTGEPDEGDLRGAIYRAASARAASSDTIFNLEKFQKIDCVKQSPKIFRCTYFIQFGIKSKFASYVGSEHQKATDSNTFTKLNGQWTILGDL